MSGCAKSDTDGLWIKGQFGSFVEELSKYTDELILLLDEIPDVTTNTFEIRTDYNIAASNVKFISLGKSGGLEEFIYRFKKIRKIFQTEQFDFILIREPSRRTPFIKFFSKNIPTVFLFGGDWVTSYRIKNNFSRIRGYLFTFFLRKNVKRSLVFVNNIDLYKRWSKYCRNIKVLYTTTIKVENIEKRAVDRFINKKYNDILFVGRLDPLKGIDTLITAVNKLNENGQKIWRLKIVGTGEVTYQKILLNKVRELQLESHIKFYDYIDFDKIYQFYNKSDVLVLPTLAENISRVIWEAMSYSCPVITTPVGGHKYAFKDKKDVLFFEPKNSNDLVEKLLYLSKNKEQCTRLTKNGLNKVASNTIDKMIMELIKGADQWITKI